MGTTGRRAIWRAAAAVLVVLVAGCGGDDDRGSDAPYAAADYFPLTAGARWTYRYTDSDGTTTDTVQVLGVAEVAGVGRGTVVSYTDPSGESRAVYVAGATGVSQYAYDRTNPEATMFDGRHLVREPIRFGEAFAQPAGAWDEGDLDLDGKSEMFRFSAQLSAVGLEAVTAAAGSFPQALHMREVWTYALTYTGGTIAPVQFTVVYDSWYVAGVGLVKGVATRDGVVTSSTELLSRDNASAAAPTTVPTQATQRRSTGLSHWIVPAVPRQ